MSGEHRFVIHGRPQVKKNQWRRPCRAYQVWESSAIIELREQRGPLEPRTRLLEGKLRARIVIYLGKAQAPDLDNVLCGPFDALQKAHVIRNDYQIHELEAVRLRDVERPRVEITLEEL